MPGSHVLWSHCLAALMTYMLSYIPKVPLRQDLDCLHVSLCTSTWQWLSVTALQTILSSMT